MLQVSTIRIIAAFSSYMHEQMHVHVGCSSDYGDAGTAAGAPFRS
jgi:hypothetical protein